MTRAEILYKERTELMEKVYHRQIPKRVPVYSLVDNYAIHYAGYTFSEVVNDPEKQYKAYEKALLDFRYDATLFSGLTRAMNFYRKLGGGTYTLKETESLQVESGTAEVMREDEYAEMAKDPVGFLLNTLYPRKYALFRRDQGFIEKYSNLSSAVDELMTHFANGKKNVQRLKEEHGILVNRGASMTLPVDLLLDYLRDFKGTMLDIRRRPEQIVEACEALADFQLRVLEDSYPKHLPGQAIFIPMHAPQFLRPKVFEQVYWPSFKRIIEAINAKGCKALCYFERNWEHLYDYLKALPVDTVIGLFEDDDIRKAKRELGGVMCIAGGMPVSKLMYGTKDECVDYAKELLQDLAPGGGYIFTTNIILHNSQDAKPENLRAVNEYVRDFGKY